MTRIKLITLAILAVFSVSAVVSAVASASEGEFVNKEGNALVKNKFTATGGSVRFETASGESISCSSSTTHGIITSKTGGEGTTLFKGCTSGSFSCKGGKDASGEAPAGSIYLSGAAVIKRTNATERLILFTVFKPGTKEAGEFELVCSGVKIRVRGSVLNSNNYKTKVLSKAVVSEARQSKGKESVTEYENEKGEKVKCPGLEVSIEGGAFESMGVEGTTTAVYEEEGQFL